MVQQNSFKAWVLAARPKTLTGAAIPVILASSLLYKEGVFNPFLSLMCLLFACSMQIAANFINDLYDFKKGTDREDRLGPERACAQGWITPGMMQKGIAAILIVACIFGLCAIAYAWPTLPMKGLEFVLLGLLCILFSFLYTTVLSYFGLGDVLVLVFFGLVPVCGTYYLQALNISDNCVILSLISGISIDALLIINNYRDRVQDKISGKKTIVVLLGETFGKNLYLIVCFTVDLLIFSLLYNGVITFLGFCLVVSIYSALHIRTWLKMVEIREGKGLNIILGQTSRNMFILAVLLSLSII